MVEFIDMKEAADSLGYKNIRSVEKWCERHQVEVISDEGTNKKYLVRLQFEYARLKKFISYLKEKYKENWLDAFQKYMSADISSVAEIEEEPSRCRKRLYKPKGDHEKKFLNDLNELSISTK